MVSQTPVGIRTSWSSLVFAVTNRLDAIDAALLRPGCLEEHVLLSHPNSSSIHEILKIHTTKMPVENSANLAKLSKMLKVSTASCSEIKGMCRDACLIAIRQCPEKGMLDNLAVSNSDFNEALRRIKNSKRHLKHFSGPTRPQFVLQTQRIELKGWWYTTRRLVDQCAQWQH